MLMNAVILNEAPGGMHVERIPVPEPRDGEVLVKVNACGVCHTDLHVIKAEVAFPTPAAFGHEISGTDRSARTGRERPSARHECRIGVHHALRALPAVRRRTR